MNIKIKDKELELVSPLSGRSQIMYENITGESLDLEQLKSINVVATLFYANICATMQKNRMALDLDYNDFLDWLDDQDKDMQVLLDYINWIAKLIGIQDKLTEKLEKTLEDEEKKTKKD